MGSPWSIGLHAGWGAKVVLGGSFLVILAGWAILIRLLVRSPGSLIEAARRWARGEFSHRIGARGPGGFGSVADAFNQMAASLQHRDEMARLRSYDQILQTEKLATVGRLAAGVAHEINNPLGGILLYGNLLLESAAEDDPGRENMSRIVAEAERASGIVRGLLDFARQTPSRIERVDLNRIVADVLSLLERQPRLQNVRVRTELCSNPLWVEADAPKMQQVFVNVIMNALDAMPNGGLLTIRSGFSEREGFCRVAISDTGDGITEENLARLFEPFFTTKEVGQGVGLGLAISYGIVREHGGDIEVQSTTGSGTTFRILLPAERED